MTDEMNKHADEIGFERQDMNAKAVYAFLIALALVGILIHFGLRGLYGYMDAYERRNQPVQNPIAPPAPEDTRAITRADVNRFPQPRLETDERTEINDFRLQEEQTLNSYGWVDQNAGVVRIPIDRAMQLLVQRGLPTQPHAGTVPPSPVNTAEQAARQADTSMKQAKPAQERKK